MPPFLPHVLWWQRKYLGYRYRESVKSHATVNFLHALVLQYLTATCPKGAYADGCLFATTIRTFRSLHEVKLRPPVGLRDILKLFLVSQVMRLHGQNSMFYPFEGPYVFCSVQCFKGSSLPRPASI